MSEANSSKSENKQIQIWKLSECESNSCYISDRESDRRKKASLDLYNFTPVLRKYMYDRWAYDQGHVLSIPANWYYLSEDISLVDIDETVVELASGRVSAVIVSRERHEILELSNCEIILFHGH